MAGVAASAAPGARAPQQSSVTAAGRSRRSIPSSVAANSRHGAGSRLCHIASEPPVRHPLFARLLEWNAARDEQRGQAELRGELLRGLSGRVLEVGAGTGVNFPHYPDSVRELVAVEPEPYLRARAEEAGAALPLDIRVVDGLAGELPFEDGSFDAAVLAGVLCSVPDPEGALRDLRRVLRPGGELRFYEHVRGREPARARWQDAVDRVWPRLMGGCHPNRDTLATIEGSGFDVVRCRGFHFPPGALAFPVAPRILGIARR